MKKNATRCRQALLWILLILNVCAPLPSFAKWEVLPFTDDSTKTRDEDKCNYSTASGNEISSKWWKPPMDAVIEAGIGVGESTYESVAPGATKLMLVVAGLWLAIFTLKVVGGFIESDPMENLTKIGGLMLRVGIAAGLLANSTDFFEYFFSPVVEIGAGFVGQSSGGGSGLSGAANALSGLAGSAHATAAKIKASGTFVRCLAYIHKWSLPIVGDVATFPDPGVFFGGCLLWLAGWALITVFPFFLIDACFRMGVVAALCPLFIVSWVFQSTRSFAMKGMNAVMNVAFTFMMINIAMKMINALMTKASGVAASDAEDTKKALVCNFRMINFAEESDPCNGIGSFSGGLVAVFAVAVCTVYGLLLMKEAADKLANYFSSTGFSNDTAFQAAKGTAQAALSAPVNAVNAVQSTADVAKGVAGGVAAAGKGAFALGRGAVNIAKGAGKKIGSIGRSVVNRFRGGGKSNASNKPSTSESKLKDWAKQRKSQPQQKQPLMQPQQTAQRSSSPADYARLQGGRRGNGGSGGGKKQQTAYYDKNGNMTRMTDAKGEHRYTRDADGKVTHTDHYDRSGRLTGVSNFSYGDDGKISSSARTTFGKDGSIKSEMKFEDGEKQTQYMDKSGKGQIDTLDSKGNVASSTRYDKNGTTGSTEYTRDKDGKVTRADLYDGNGNKTHSSNYSYDDKGQLSSVTKTDAGGQTVRQSKFNYDSNGKMTAMSETTFNQDGSRTEAVNVGGVEQTHHYDKNGVQTSMTDAQGEHRYTRDANGRVIHTDHYDRQGNKTGSNDFAYGSDGKVSKNTETTIGRDGKERTKVVFDKNKKE